MKCPSRNSVKFVKFPVDVLPRDVDKEVNDTLQTMRQETCQIYKTLPTQNFGENPPSKSGQNYLLQKSEKPTKNLQVIQCDLIHFETVN